MNHALKELRVDRALHESRFAHDAAMKACGRGNPLYVQDRERRGELRNRLVAIGTQHNDFPDQ
jgi:hypothetical protein